MFVFLLFFIRFYRGHQTRRRHRQVDCLWNIHSHILKEAFSMGIHSVWVWYLFFSSHRQVFVNVCNGEYIHERRHRHQRRLLVYIAFSSFQTSLTCLMSDRAEEEIILLSFVCEQLALYSVSSDTTHSFDGTLGSQPEEYLPQSAISEKCLFICPVFIISLVFPHCFITLTVRGFVEMG